MSYNFFVDISESPAAPPAVSFNSRSTIRHTGDALKSMLKDKLFKSSHQQLPIMTSEKPQGKLPTKDHKKSFFKICFI